MRGRVLVLQCRTHMWSLLIPLIAPAQAGAPARAETVLVRQYADEATCRFIARVSARTTAPPPGFPGWRKAGPARCVPAAPDV